MTKRDIIRTPNSVRLSMIFYIAGSRPNGEDIIGFTATGLATVVTIDSIDVTNGAVLYFTVKGIV